MLVVLMLAPWFAHPESLVGWSLTAQEHASRAQRLIQSQRYAQAEIELQSAVTKAPRNVAYLSDLASVLRAQQKLKEAERYYRLALKLAPNNVAVLRNLALVQWDGRDLRAARDTLQTALRLQPKDATTMLMLGVISERLHDYLGAIRLLGTIGPVHQTPEALVALANSYYRAQQPDNARQIAQQLLELNLENWEPVFACGISSEEAGDYLTAERMFRAVESRYPDPDVLDHHLAVIHFRQGRIDESRKRLLETVGRGKATAATYNLLGHCYQSEGKVEEALASFHKGIELQPDEPINHIEGLRLLARHNQWRAVLETSQKATQRFPRVAELFEVKGVAETVLLLTADAIRSFQRALELNPSSPRASLGLAVARSAAGLAEEAERSFQRGLERFPMDALHYQEYGLMLLKRVASGEREVEAQAVLLLKKALTLNNELSDAHYQLGQIELRQRNLESARQHLEAAAKLDPGRSKVLFALSRAYRAMGKTTEAEQAFQKFQQLREVEEKSNPGFPAIGQRENRGTGAPQ